ncbi:FAD-dependent oxidoreductase [Solwaraspora sp. WMMB762]|uniref:FAD-dependent oxidoreductase n=1 Tax=Solwaraspora sp. WMMB762 TaxID=3404120 RepID=UPI003B96612F
MTLRATIVGAGLAGSLTAVALARSGVGTSVYEAYLDPAGTTGGFLNLTANALGALHSVGCLEQIQARGIVVNRLCLWNGEGRLLGRLSRAGRLANRPMNLSIMRGDLVSVLRDEAVRAGAEVHTGRWLAGATSSTGGVTAQFIDGARVECDVLVGADGTHSRVRRVISNAAPPPEYGGHCAIDGVTRLPGIAAGTLHLVVSRQGCFQYTAKPDGTVWWNALVPTGDLDPAELAGISEQGWRSRLSAQYGQGDTPCAALIAQCTTLGRPAPLYLPQRLAHWRRGRMVVLGDAAHPVGYGLGAGLALEDAVVLGRCLRDIDDVPMALTAYESMRRSRTERALRAGTRYGRFRNLPGRGWLDVALAPLYRRYFWGGASSWLLAYDVEWHRQVRV